MISPMKLERRATTAPAILVYGMRITPEASALTIGLPFASLVWNRPRAVLVEQAGELTRVPIPDVTRIAQLALWLCAATCVCAIPAAIHYRKEHAS